MEAVAKVAVAIVNAIVNAVLGASAAVAEAREDGELSDEQAEELFEEKFKALLGASILAFGSGSSGSNSDINGETIEVVDEGKINTEQKYTAKEINEYISSFWRGHYMGKKIYFANEISELPAQIVTKSGGYTNIYELQEYGRSVPFSTELYYGDEFTNKDGTVFSTKEYMYQIVYTDWPEQPQISQGIIFVAPALTAEEAALGYKKTTSPDKLLGSEHEPIKTSREGLNEKPEVSDTARKQGANKDNTDFLTKNEKKIANKHLDDLIAARNGDTEAASRLADQEITRVHDLDRQYDGYKSLDLVDENSGWNNINRLLYKEVSDGIEWKIVRMHR